MLDEAQRKKVGQKIDKIVKNLTSKKPGKEAKVPGAVVGLTSDKETFYFNYQGVLDTETQQPVNEHTRFAFFSCTKAMTAFAVLQLYEKGKLKLDDEVRKYLPAIEELYIVEKGSVNKKTGEFLSPPKRPTKKITIRNLLTMTAGMSYPFLNEEYTLLAKYNEPHINSVAPAPGLFKTTKTPLIHEPGSIFSYGHSMDWAGLVVEKASGKTLSQYLKENLFDPVGMSSCTFHVKDTNNMMKIYRRNSKGVLVPAPKAIKLDPEIDMGGQGCFGNVGDYLKFIRVWLNYGYSPDGKVRLLNEDLVKFAVKNHLPPGVTVHFDVPGFPQIPDGFSLAGMATTKELPATGRPIGSVYWSGLANLYYWVDFENGLGGFWASQIMPLGDPHSFLGYCKTEMAVYDVINGEDDDEEDEEEEEEEDDTDNRESKL